MPSSIHDQADAWLAAALAGDLSPAEQGLLEAHLADCARCRTLQNEMTMTHEMLQNEFAPAVGPQPGFEARLMTGFRRRQERRPTARFVSLMGWLVRLRGVQVAGVAALLLALVEVGNVVSGGGSGVFSGNRSNVRYAAASSVQHGLQRGLAINNDARISGGVLTLDGANTYTGATRLLGEPGLTAGAQPQAAPPLPGIAQSENQPVTVNVKAMNGTATYNRQTSPNRDYYFSTNGPALGAGKSDQNGRSQSQGSLSFGLGTAKLSSLADTKDGPAAVELQTTVSAGDMRVPAYRDGTPVSNQPAAGEALARQAGVPGEAPPAALDARKLIRNARAEIEVASFEAAVDAISSAAAQDGGYIDTKNSARGANGKLRGTLVVKVLPDNLDRFLLRLRALGEIKNQSIQTEDVTKAYFDTEARMRNSQRMEERLLKMLDEVKGKMSEVLQVEKELARVRSDIEQMQGELKVYDAQVRYATISLNLYEKDLNQPAAFLLRETANLSLLATDVEKTFTEARRIADAAKAQVLASNVERDSTGRISATLRLLSAPDKADAIIAQTKALGRVRDYTMQDERVAQNGAPANAAGAETAKVERDMVTFNIAISHDEQTRRQVSLTIIPKEIDAAFDQARAAAANAGAEITNSNVTHPQDGHSSALLAARVPARAYAALLDAFKTLGRPADFQTQREASNANGAAAETDDGPTLITLNLTDAETPAQRTNVRVRTADTEKQLGEIKQAAAVAGAEVRDSSFSRESDGGEHAQAVIRLPLSAYPALIERIRALGEVKDFTVQRQDRPVIPGPVRSNNDANAPAEITLSLYSDGQIVGENSGVGSTLRRTFGQGIGALMWSVQMIGVAVAFIAPWAAVLALTLWLIRRWQTRRGARLETKKAE